LASMSLAACLASSGDSGLQGLPLPAAPPAKGNIQIRGRFFRVTHDPKKMGGLPSRIEFPRGGKVFDTFAWNDRLYHPKLGSYGLRHDTAAEVEWASRGPLCDVVRVRGRYVKPDGSRPESKPQAAYEWVYFRDLPLAFVRATVTQQADFAWRELHFLELNYPDRSFGSWAGGEPLQTGTFAAKKKGFGFPDWGLIREGPNAIAMLRCLENWGR